MRPTVEASHPPLPLRPAWHALTADETALQLGCTLDGLSSVEAAELLAKNGPNLLPAPRRRSAARILLGQVRSPLIYLLLVAGAVSAAMGEVSDAVFVFLVLAINTAIGAWQELRADRQMSKLRQSSVEMTSVRRDGVVRKIAGRDLVCGDLVVIEAGDHVPADLRLVAASELQVDESLLTGESLEVEKLAREVLPSDTPLAERLNMLEAGTLVRRGNCTGLVIATGPDTEIGQAAAVIARPQPEPPITLRLNRLARTLGWLSIALVGVVIAVRLMAGADPRETLFVAVALAVSVIPEGLPVAVTAALSIAAARMASRNVVVRQLAAVEGLGACTVVATDKTGTLTVNQLTARRLWLPGRGMFKVSGEGLSIEGAIDGIERREDGQRHAIRRLVRSATLANNAAFDPEAGRSGSSGDALDLALLVLAGKAELTPEAEREAAPRLSELPFSAERRYAASLNLHESGHRLHIKGAPEVILPLCVGADTGAVMRAVDEMASEGHRVIAIATQVEAEPNSLDDGTELGDLELLGLVGFIDPLRPEARSAVADCRRAGVSVKMITGDHAVTALALARELGIAQSMDEVVTGRELAVVGDDPEALQRISAAAVFARIEPSQKALIVDALRSAGHFVAMTGDGVNDAPALVRAEIGVAMGRDGSDAARDAADLVLTDDNFASIVAGIEEGRAAYINIRKVIYLLLGTGIAEALMFILALLAGLPLPLTAVQLLWLNLVTNGGQDVALAFEKPEPGLLERPPRKPLEPILDATMLRQILLSGGYMGLASFGCFAWLLHIGVSEAEARNMLLFLLVLFENAQVLNARSETRSVFRNPLSNNWMLMIAIAVAQAMQIAAPFVPGLRDVLEVSPISPANWAMLLLAAASLVLVVETDKRLQSWRASRG